MIVRVDIGAGETIEGFSYKNVNGDLETVLFTGSYVRIVDEDDDMVTYFEYEDIPNLIKALEAAYKEKTK